MMINKVNSIKINNPINDEDISGIAYANGLIVVGSDEGSKIQILRLSGLQAQVLGNPINLLADDQEELDIEAITYALDNTYYVLGSHSAKRKKVKKKKDYLKNRKRITIVKKEISRSHVFKLFLNDVGQLNENIDSISLDEIFAKDEILQLFTEIPSKENGIDLEGSAWFDNHIYLGFRGPVLRGNYAIILKLDFNNPIDYQMLFVQLDGRGIRDMIRVKDGFLILSGPVSDGDSRFFVNFWNGLDGIPGKNSPDYKNILLGEVSTPEGCKAEGITLMEETENKYRVIIVFDGKKLTELDVFEIDK